MSKKTKQQSWIEAKKKHHLSDNVIMMGKQLGLNPKKFGSIANHKQEKWKAPLPDFIKALYRKRFKGDNKTQKS